MGGERGRRLLILDHHASSLDQLAAQGLKIEAASGPDAPGLKRVAVDDPAVTVLIDESRCSTRLAFDHRDR